MRVKTKLESIETMKRLGLNQFQEVFLNGFDEDKIKAFMDATKVEFYDVRDKTVAASTKTRCLKAAEIIDYCREINLEKFTVSISFRNYLPNQTCVGELCIRGDVVDYLLSHNQTYSPRDMKRDPDYNGTMHLFDRRIRYIKGLQEAIDYAFEHNLLNVIIEFWVFNRPVGINNEKVVLRELRSDY
ncbi:MAG: hypothetical protein LBL47_03385 [Lactobacillus sp.]|jgi:hypothetical protein|nr:hypothetical protein [Lactobacillus sp.]